MRTILITIGVSIKARKLLWTDFLKFLREASDLKIVLLAPQDKIGFYKTQFESGNVIVNSMPEDSLLNKIDVICRIVARSSVPTFTRKSIQYRNFYKSDRGLARRLANFLSGRIFWHLSKLRLWREFLRFVYYLIPVENSYKTILEKYNPDLVYATDILDFRGFKLLKAAKKKKIKTLTQILSWDNLTAKLFICIKTDNFIVPTNLVKEELIKYGDCKPEIIFVAGIPQCDHYFKKESIIKREVFLKQIGTDPHKKLILYACGGRKTSPTYMGIFEQLNEIIIKKKVKYPVQIMIRPYPKYELTKQEMERIKSYKFLLDKTSMKMESLNQDIWEMEKDGMVYLANLLYHSDISMTFSSTIVIDAAIYNTPSIYIVYDVYAENTPYWSSVERVREREHNQHLTRLKGQKTVYNQKELILAMNEYLENPDLDKEGREKIVQRQFQFLDGKSGERMANFVLSLIK